MSDREHPVKQDITFITVSGDPNAPDSTSIWFQVGVEGVTRIEACTKSGMHADIPYVRVWKGDRAVAEFCQHNIVGVYFFT